MSFRISDGDFMNLPQRKLQRLLNYNYSQNNAYFITICTQNRLPLFGRIENSNLILNNAGLMVFNKFEEISGFYPDIIIDKFIVMPNHLHAIMLIQHDGTAQGPFPTLSEYIHMKVLGAALPRMSVPKSVSQSRSTYQEIPVYLSS